MNQLELTEEERSVIFGTLLGDAHLQKRGNSYRLKIEHAQANADYVQWKYKKLFRLCQTTHAPKPFTSKSGFTTQLFYTSSSPLYQSIHELFYQPIEKSGGKVKYVKTITEKLLSHLPVNDLVLAVWFMDDGSIREDCYAGKIATMCFSQEEQLLLQQYLLDVYSLNLSVVIHLESKNQYYLSVPASTFRLFSQLIEPHVEEVTSMVYKLNRSRFINLTHNKEKPCND